MQICGEGEQEIKMNFLSFFDTEELRKTIARDEMKKNQGTYFDNIEEDKTEPTYITDDKIENTLSNEIDENVLENKVENKTKKEDKITTTKADNKVSKK